MSEAATAVTSFIASLGAAGRRVADEQWGISIDDVAGWPLHVGLAIRDGLLRAQAEALAPDQVSDHELLFRNRSLALVRFAHSGSGAVWVHGDLPLGAVGAAELDRLLGLLVAAAVDARHRAVGRVPALTLRRLDGTFAFCRLAGDADVPAWAAGDGALLSVTRTATELSIVCPFDAVPDDGAVAGPYAALAVDAVIDPATVGVLAGLTAALARDGLALMAISTYDTDLLLVSVDDVERAAVALRGAGHTVVLGPGH